MSCQGQRAAKKPHQDTVKFIELRSGNPGGLKNDRPATRLFRGELQTGLSRRFVKAWMGCYRGYIVRPPLEFAAHGMGLHGQVEKQRKSIRFIPLGCLNQPFCQKFGVLKKLVCRLIDEEGTMNPRIRNPRGYIRSLASVWP